MILRSPWLVPMYVELEESTTCFVESCYFSLAQALEAPSSILLHLIACSMWINSEIYGKDLPTFIPTLQEYRVQRHTAFPKHPSGSNSF